jgi:hypothetical protein
VCRSKAEGGRRCPGAGSPDIRGQVATAPAPAAASRRGRATSRAGARARWAQVQRQLDEAKSAVGPPLGNPSYLVLSPLARQADHARPGGDPAAYDPEVAQGKDMLTRLLVSHGGSPAAAAAKVSALETAWAAWAATPEAQP